MKLLNKDIEPRLSVKLDRTISIEKAVTGIMRFGSENDYPQLIEKLILGSQSAKNAANTYADYLAGEGFANPNIGKLVVGKDDLNKDITLDSIRIAIAESLSKFHGAYIHCNMNLDGEVGNTKVVSFVEYRLSRSDDKNYSAKLAYNPNWNKDKDKAKFDKNKTAWFDVFNDNPKIIQEQVKHTGGIEKYKGQIYPFYADNTYLYPLSPFDSSYLDMDTEFQIQLFKNNEIRNGFSDKVVMHISSALSDDKKEEQVKKIQSWMGPDGDKALVFESVFDENGNLQSDGNYKMDAVKSNINDKLFEQWEKSLTNNIRKSVKLPAVLIDYDSSALSGTSGETFIQASNFYNALTESYRNKISEVIKEIYSKHSNPMLKANNDWGILPLNLAKYFKNGTT